MMHSIKSYLARQSTAVLENILKKPMNQAYKENAMMVEDILLRRRYLMRKFSPSRLAAMSSKALIMTMNNPEIRTEDLVVSRTVIYNILEILEMRGCNANTMLQPALIKYLRKWACFSSGRENWEMEDAAVRMNDDHWNGIFRADLLQEQEII